MSKKGGLFAGLVVGATLGLLFAPKKGEDTRKDLVNKMKSLWEKAKDIEYDDVKESIEKSINDIQKELKDLDKEKVVSIVKKKGKEIEKKANDLYNLAVEKGTPVLEKAASDVRQKTIEVLNDTVAKLEKAENKAK